MGRARHHVLTQTASYFAVYPDGRRCSVTLESIDRNFYQWQDEGIRILTVVTHGKAPVFHDEETDYA